MMERDSIRFGGSTIEYQVRRSKRRKRNRWRRKRQIVVGQMPQLATRQCAIKRPR